MMRGNHIKLWSWHHTVCTVVGIEPVCLPYNYNDKFSKSLQEASKLTGLGCSKDTAVECTVQPGGSLQNEKTLHHDIVCLATYWRPEIETKTTTTRRQSLQYSCASEKTPSLFWTECRYTEHLIIVFCTCLWPNKQDALVALHPVELLKIIMFVLFCFSYFCEVVLLKEVQMSGSQKLDFVWFQNYNWFFNALLLYWWVGPAILFILKDRKEHQ